jgi:Clostripain family
MMNFEGPINLRLVIAILACAELCGCIVVEGNEVDGVENPNDASISDAHIQNSGDVMNDLTPSVPCDGIPLGGKCEGAQVVFCEQSEIKKIDCARVGASCELTDGVADCTVTRANAGCRGVEALGTCLGTNLVYCDQTGLSEVLRGVDCADYGQSCAPMGAQDNGAICESWGRCPVDLGESGRCSGNRLEFCENGEVYRFECGNDVCMDVGGRFFDCTPVSLTLGCGVESAVGRCDGNKLVRCEGDVVVDEDCGAMGMRCGEATPGGYKLCLRDQCSNGCAQGHTCMQNRCVADNPQADWNIMVYMVGDNNLAGAGWRDLNEMEVVGSTAKVRVFVQYEFSNDPSPAGSRVPAAFRVNTYWGEAKRDEDPWFSSTLPASTSLGDLNMSSPGVLGDFIRRSAEAAPAKRYGLVLWNHGTGWMGGFNDDGDKGAMSLPELVTGVRRGGVPLDVLDFDACGMGMFEIAMAFRGLADFLVASENVEPADGNDYERVLGALSANSGMAGFELGRSIVDSFHSYYLVRPRPFDVTKSVTNLSWMESLNRELSAMSNSIRGSLSGNRLAVLEKLKPADTMRFTFPQNADVSSVLSKLSEMPGSLGASALALSASQSLKSAQYYSQSQGAFLGAGGLAIYLPFVNPKGELTRYRTELQMLPIEPWTYLLSALHGGEQPGNVSPIAPGRSFSISLSWGDEPGMMTSMADLDLHVYEPGGTLASPALGSVSPNGFLSADSAYSGLPAESYQLAANHASGSYLVLVHYFGGQTPAYPTLTIRDDILPGGAQTLVRGKTEMRRISQIPMDGSTKLVNVVDSENLEAVLSFTYSDIWYATVIEVP